MFQKSIPGHLSPENLFPWCIRKHGYAHFHGGSLLYGESRYPTLGEMISKFLL